MVRNLEIEKEAREKGQIIRGTRSAGHLLLEMPDGKIYTISRLAEIYGWSFTGMKSRVKTMEKVDALQHKADVGVKTTHKGNFSLIDMGPRIDLASIKIGSWESENF